MKAELEVDKFFKINKTMPRNKDDFIWGQWYHRRRSITMDDAENYFGYSFKDPEGEDPEEKDIEEKNMEEILNELL